MQEASKYIYLTARNKPGEFKHKMMKRVDHDVKMDNSMEVRDEVLQKQL
jgi:hypothetical protein